MSCRENEHLRKTEHLRVLMWTTPGGGVANHQASGAWARGVGPDETGGRHELYLRDAARAGARTRRAIAAVAETPWHSPGELWTAAPRALHREGRGRRERAVRAKNRLAGVIVGRAIYRDGERVLEPQDFAEMAAACRDGGGIAWIGLYRPTHDEFADVAREFGLHELAVEDAVNAHQRAKLEHYGETLFCVLHPARYIDETETVEFEEVHVFAGPQFVITVRHGQAPDLAAVRRGLEARPDLLRRGPVAILHAIMDRVVDDYAPVVAGVETDIDEIEDEVFGVGVRADVSRRIYQLTREVIAVQRATKPLVAMLERLIVAPGVEDEEARYMRDVQDHALRVQEQADGFRELLQNILSVNLTLETKTLSEVSNQQNDQVKKISAWAAILFAPSMVGTIYGMNFDHMPELHWRQGYPFALALMAAVCLALYLLFKRSHWI
jgi:magnesium transporter